MEEKVFWKFLKILSRICKRGNAFCSFLRARRLRFVLNPNVYLLFGNSRVPTAAARARQDRRGPSLRPCLKSDPKWSRIALKSNVSLIFLALVGLSRRPAAFSRYHGAGVGRAGRASDREGTEENISGPPRGPLAAGSGLCRNSENFSVRFTGFWSKTLHPAQQNKGCLGRFFGFRTPSPMGLFWLEK